jgi:hypothetical protein
MGLIAFATISSGGYGSPLSRGRRRGGVRCSNSGVVPRHRVVHPADPQSLRCARMMALRRCSADNPSRSESLMRLVMAPESLMPSTALIFENRSRPITNPEALFFLEVSFWLLMIWILPYFCCRPNSVGHKHSFAISPRLRASFDLLVRPSGIRGRRECRALDTPAAARGG